MRGKPVKMPQTSQRRMADVLRFEEPRVEAPPSLKLKIVASAGPIDTGMEDDDLADFFAPEYGGSE